MMLSELCKYEISREEIDVIKYNLSKTNDELNEWDKHTFSGSAYTMQISLAKDAEDPDITHIIIQAGSDLREQLKMLNLFQSMFKELNPEHDI